MAVTRHHSGRRSCRSDLLLLCCAIITSACWPSTSGATTITTTTATSISTSTSPKADSATGATGAVVRQPSSEVSAGTAPPLLDWPLPQHLPVSTAATLLLQVARNLNCSSANWSGSCDQCPSAAAAVHRYVALASGSQQGPLPVGGRTFPAATNVSLHRLAKVVVLMSLAPLQTLCNGTVPITTASGDDGMHGRLLEKCSNASCVEASLSAVFHRPHLDLNSILRPVASVVGAAGGGSVGSINSLEIDGVLRQLNRYYVPRGNSSVSDTKGAECINGDSMLNEIEDNSSKSEDAQLSAIATSILRHLLKGDCFAVSPEDVAIIEQLFAQFATYNETTKVRRMQRTGLSAMINQLNFGHQCEIVTNGKFNSRVVSTTPMTNGEDKNGHRDHSDHSHKRRRSVAGDNQRHQPACLDSQKLFNRFDKDHSNELSVPEFATICEWIISDWLTHSHPAGDGIGGGSDVQRAPVPPSQQPGSNTQAYVYGTLSIAIISLCSMLGVVVIPCMTTKMYNLIMVALVAMGFGILTGDAILHLVPQALGLHPTSHEEGAGGHSHGEEEPFFPDYLSKCMAMLGSIYVLFLFDTISQAFNPHSHSHGHQHQNGKSDSSDSKANEKKEKAPSVAINLKSISQQTLTSHGESPNGTDDSQTDSPVIIHNFAESSPVIFCGMKSLALMVLIGDTIHNFADGLVVGAAFAGGMQGGLSSSLAVLCHELPHELGDFALLLSTGMSKRLVILSNLFSSLSAFIGLYIGVAIGSNESVVRWTMAVTAGMFLFVGIGNMMPELKALTTNHPRLSSLIQNIAVLTGMGFTILMALFEKSIHI